MIIGLDNTFNRSLAVYLACMFAVSLWYINNVNKGNAEQREVIVAPPNIDWNVFIHTANKEDSNLNNARAWRGLDS